MNIQVHAIERCNLVSNEVWQLYLQGELELQEAGYGAGSNFCTNYDDPVLYATVDEQLAGILVYRHIEYRRSYFILFTYVVEEHRQCGVFSALLERFKQYAVEAKAVQLELGTHNSNKVAQNVYEALGFKAESVTYTQQLAPS